MQSSAAVEHANATDVAVADSLFVEDRLQPAAVLCQQGEQARCTCEELRAVQHYRIHVERRKQPVLEGPHLVEIVLTPSLHIVQEDINVLVPVGSRVLVVEAYDVQELVHHRADLHAAKPQ